MTSVVLSLYHAYKWTIFLLEDNLLISINENSEQHAKIQVTFYFLFHAQSIFTKFIHCLSGINVVLSQMRLNFFQRVSLLKRRTIAIMFVLQ